MEVVRYTFPTWVVPLSNVIFILTAVMVINSVIRLLKSSFALGQGELILLYVTPQLRDNARWLRCIASDSLRAWTQFLVRNGRKRMAYAILAPPPAMAHGFR